MERNGCDKVEVQKAIEKLKLMNKELDQGKPPNADNVPVPAREPENQNDFQPSTSRGIAAAGFTRLVIPESDSDSENTG